MKKFFLSLAFLLTCTLAMAQVDKMLGDWTTVDDKTGEKRSIVTIYQGQDGLYYGKVKQLLVGKRDVVCEACEGADHLKPIEGLVIVRGMKAEDGELKGGRVLDPESGKLYYARIYMKEGHLVLRGSLDKRGFLGRNQTWNRLQ